MRCDVTSTDDVDAAFTAVEEHFGGPVEVLVSNAGITKDGLLLRMTEDDFTAVLDANLTASYRVVKAGRQGDAEGSTWTHRAGVVGRRPARLGRSGELRRVEGRARRLRPLAGP